MNRSKLIIVDGPAGAGKTTICTNLAQDLENICYMNVDNMKIPFRESVLGFNRVIDMPVIFKQLFDLCTEESQKGKVLLADESFGGEFNKIVEHTKANNIELLPIFLKVDLKTALFRNSIRSKVKAEQKIIDTWHKSNEVLKLTNDFRVIDASLEFPEIYNLVKSEVVDFTQQ